MIKLIVSDLDGTLLNKAHLLDEESAQAILKAQANGYEFMVATGRHDGSVLPMFDDFQITCKKILLNGAICLDEQGNLMNEVVMDKEIAFYIMDVLESHDVQAQLYTKEGIAAMHPEVILNDFRAHLKAEGMCETEIDEVIEKNNFGDLDIEIIDLPSYFATNPTVYKIEAFGNDEKVMEEVHDIIDKVKGIAISRSISNNFEVTDEKAQKGIMLEALLPRLGYTKEEVLFFGDSLNDLTMMQLFPYAVAMENASPEIMDAASYKIGLYSDHAVAKAIHHVIELQK